MKGFFSTLGHSVVLGGFYSAIQDKFIPGQIEGPIITWDLGPTKTNNLLS